MLITIPGNSFEIQMKADSTEAYLHLVDFQSDASLQSISSEILEDYNALGASLRFTSEAECLFSVVFLSEVCFENFVKKLEEIEKVLAEHVEVELLKPTKQKNAAIPQEVPDQRLNMQCKLAVFLAEETEREVYPTNMKQVTLQKLSSFKERWPCNTGSYII